MNTVTSFDVRALAGRFLARTTHAPVATLFIDGHSGSGKTTLARTFAGELQRLTPPAAQPVRPPRILGMDELYPGWNGLAEGSAALAGVLAALTYRRYDWQTAAFGAPQQLDAQGTLIVEGCGSISRQALTAARARGPVYAVWIASAEPLRHARAIARDGDMFAPYWESWAAQERELFARTQPRAHANEIVHVT